MRSEGYSSSTVYAFPLSVFTVVWHHPARTCSAVLLLGIASHHTQITHTILAGLAYLSIFFLIVVALAIGRKLGRVVVSAWPRRPGIEFLIVLGTTLRLAVVDFVVTVIS
jgi:hypothetical protein